MIVGELAGAPVSPALLPAAATISSPLLSAACPAAVYDGCAGTGEPSALSAGHPVEEFVPGRELTVAVMGGKDNEVRALDVTEILPKTAFYDYDAKYAPGGSEHVVPANIPDAIRHECMALAERAHVALGCRGVTRTDFRYDDTEGRGRIVVLEVNTQPGMTPTSLVPEQAAYKGMSYRALVRWMLEELRVNYFAQSLGTPYPISDKRIYRALDDLSV